MSRRLRIAALALIFGLLLTFATITTLAQETTPEPPADLIALATQVAGDLAEMQQLREAADAALGYAYDLFGLFEGITAIIGLAIPLLFGVAGFIGLRRILEAEKRLDDVRTRFETEMGHREQELTILQERLASVAEEQRQRTARATLAQALLPIGERQYRAQDFTGAIGTYQRALELDPDNPNTQYRLGYVYVQSGELDKAQEHLKKALQIDEKFAPALATLGYVYRRIGEQMETGMERSALLNEAERNLLEALKISPRLVDDDGESWWGSLGGLYRRRGQTEQAIHAYEQAALVTPQSSYPFSNLALLYLQQRNKDRMLQIYKRVEQLAMGEVQADVDNYWAYSDLLTSRLALGKVEEAEQTLEHVFETRPQDSPYVLSTLIDTLERLTEALGGPNAPEAKHIPQYIARIHDFIATTQNKRVEGETAPDHPATGEDSVAPEAESPEKT